MFTTRCYGAASRTPIRLVPAFSEVTYVVCLRGLLREVLLWYEFGDQAQADEVTDNPLAAAIRVRPERAELLSLPRA